MEPRAELRAHAPSAVGTGAEVPAALAPSVGDEEGATNRGLRAAASRGWMLDDGDSRDIHIKDIRYLPPNYPLVDKEDDQIAAILGGRRRSQPGSTDPLILPFTPRGLARRGGSRVLSFQVAS